MTWRGPRSRTARRLALALAGAVMPFVATSTSTAAAADASRAGRALGVQVATLEGRRGATVVGLVAGLPAAGAGLRPGDTIVELAGTSVTSGTALAQVASHLEPGEVRLVWVDAHGASHRRTIELLAPPRA